MKELLLWEIMNESQKQTRQRSCMQESKLATSVSKRATWNMCSRGALGNIKAERLKAKVVFMNFGIVVVSFWEWEVVCRNGKQGFHTGVFCVNFIIVHWRYVCDWTEDVSYSKCERTTDLQMVSLSLPEQPACRSPGDTVGRLPWEREPGMRVGLHLGPLPARHACWAIRSLTPVSAGSCSGEEALSGAVTGSRLIIRFISLRLTRQGRLENAKAARQHSGGRLFIYF